jgi:hypothetical protein
MAIGILFGEIGVGHKAQSTSTILSADSDDASTGQTLPEFGTIVLSAESTSMEIDHDGEGFVDGFCRCDDTEVEAILAHHVVADIATLGLRGPLGYGLGLIDTLPGLSRLRRLPTEVAHGGSGKGDGIVTGEVGAFEYALDIASFNMGFEQGLSLRGQHTKQSADRHHQFLFHTFVKGFRVIMIFIFYPLDAICGQKVS